MPAGHWKAYLRQKLQMASEGELRLIGRSLFSRTIASESVQGRVHELNVEAARKYQPQPYQGVVTNLRPTKNYSAFPDPDMGWGGLALEGIKTIDLDLNPHAMLTEPFVQRLADQLSQELSKALPY